MSADPYASLDSHVISVKALYCEDGCGLVETSGYGDDDQAAKELAARGWEVRPHNLGGLTALCKHCVERYDIEAAEDDEQATTDHPKQPDTTEEQK